MKSTRCFIKEPFVLLMVALLMMVACKNNKKSDGFISNKDNFKLVWNDEFNYTGLPDSLKWSYDTTGNAFGWGNHELQGYTAACKENAFVSDGTLKVRAIKEKSGGFDYSSARLITKYKGDWTFGRF